MKVRQSVSVTSELGDQNNLALFNGENWVNWSSLAFRFGASSFCDERSTCKTFKDMLPTSTPFHTNKNIHAHTTRALSPTHKYTQAKKFCVSAEHPHTHSSPAQESALLQQINLLLSHIILRGWVFQNLCVCVYVHGNGMMSWA